MTPRARRGTKAKATSGPVLLDWRDSSHWSSQPKPCRYCGFDTCLRDSRRKPAHKTCAEEALAQQAADAADAYRKDTL
ncbi:hypothetical protein CG747_20680 [Streptomyces sp. CB02959]|uniref:hypothetical protein n=1 Tax=Streptomyces sp. CB02959 TaxID=2020330 RepID=UPI000C2810D0|nr:hypothetical protein [Streptomyces sp. CB02959]PJN38963.1 hypothetical protein CG747_20680 [Streptomyces sp. CB02959]